MKILIVSDAWRPQINGVVRTLETTLRELEKLGHDVQVIGPEACLWNTVSAPSYPAIKLELFAGRRLVRVLDAFDPDCIHIATEGPLGWAARNLCLQRRLPFTTSYHTRFPEYLAMRAPRFLAYAVQIFAYAALRRFHAPSSAIMVSTRSVEMELRRRKFRRLARWSRGVDMNLFRPIDISFDVYAHLPRPVMLYVGRVAAEKNLRAFLDVTSPGSKVVVGDGPDLAALRNTYPDAVFTGTLHGETLARYYAAADLFVFPSLTDTFGLVLLEACASGLRIASVPAPGPADILGGAEAQAFAVLDADIGHAIKAALCLPNDATVPRAFAEAFSWQSCTRQFLNHLQAASPKAVRRIGRLRLWLGRWWRHALALALK